MGWILASLVPKRSRKTEETEARKQADCKLRRDLEEHQRQLKRKQKNQAAAQRSRQRHTDKADALHQQHESLEKHNHTLRREIRALQSELAWWGRILHLHERLCPVDAASLSAPGRPGPHGCVGQPDIFQTPASPPPARHISPALQPYKPPGLLASPLPSPSVGPDAVPVPPAQLSTSPVPPPSSACSSLLGPSLELSTLLSSPPAPTAPLQPLRWEHPAGGKPESSPHSPLAPLGLARPQSGEYTPASAFSTANRQGLGVGLRPCPLPAFPLLSSAQVHF
ncbi:basic leucine zipper transcriptional factor ATF-like 2 isoform X1 [Elephas maximus indicus]|uniref:basic leucine zipper transcriptional factor ATF-like 2 isoform X1 n=1 Tax=Elephas maximus indicus TaxID=99487 RepID=UPI0021163BCA|nr:basic leucine zipper transcriptional factor ATF-like 2 isoform X1 [Elephas maximus indicus]